MKRRRLNILIGSGPTREPIDAVRFISNYSTGYMGLCLVNEALKRRHRVTVISGPSELSLPKTAEAIHVEQAHQMQEVMKKHACWADAIIMAAAVCDFRPKTKSQKKIARRGILSLKLKATPDILSSIPRRKNQIVAGFALETGQAIEGARRKLKSKKLDLIVAQDARFCDGPFGKNRLKASLLNSGNKLKKLGIVSKKRLACAILDEIEQLCYGGKKV